MASVSQSKVTGVSYDKCLEAHYSLWNKDYTEHPLRTRVCIERCEELGLLERCKRIPVREATLKEIQVCHTKHHYELLRSSQRMDEKMLQELSQQYDYIYFHKNSFESARLALGATIDLVEEVVTEKISNGMAIVRPPGHHAMREEYNGYCYFNNVAVAAQLMMDNHGLERIVILDWDVHHGQGTQFLFYNDPRVLYISMHRYEYGREWPCLRESDYDFIGEGAGKGYNINLPLNEIECGNDEFLSMFFNVILPVCQEFNPQLVLVSAGFDSAIGCPEGEMSVTPACFANFVNLLTPLAGGKLALVLEGGYNLKSLAESTALSLRALLGDTTPLISPIAKPKTSLIESVLGSLKCLAPYWKSLHHPDIVDRDSIVDEKHQYPIVLTDPPAEGVHFHDDDSRPKLYPLIQDCVNESAKHHTDELDKRIDCLIKNTSLFCPQYKLNISQYSHPSTSCVYNCLCEHLKSKNLWNLSHHIVSNSSSYNYPHLIQSSVSKSLDAIMGNTSEAGLVITGHDLEENSDVEDMPCDYQYPAVFSVKYAKNNHSANRVMVVQILDENSSPAVTEALPGVLLITLSLAQLKGHEKPQPTHISSYLNNSHLHAQPTSIHIPFIDAPPTDADILTALHLIILPVAYEFYPELVVFTWDNTTKVSGTVMGILTQYLHGLAQGKMLMLVNQPVALSAPSSPCSSTLSGNGNTLPEHTPCHVNVNNVEIITQVLSVLLTQKCSRLPSDNVSSRGMQVIRETIDGIKHQWKSLVYREQIPKH